MLSATRSRSFPRVDAFDFGGLAPPQLARMQRLPLFRLRRQAGVGEGWHMPVALWSSDVGYGEQVFTSQTDQHTLSVLTAPVPIRCVLRGHEGVDRGETGHFTFFQEGESLRFVAPAGAQFAHLYLEPRFLTLLADELALTRGRSAALEAYILHRHDAELRREIDAYLSRALDPFDPPNDLEMNARATLIGIRMLRTYADGGPRTMRRVARGGLAPTQLRRVCDFIDAHLDGPVGLRTLAGLCGLSTSHFCTAFAQSMGMPPHRWLTTRRIDRAKALLRSSSASLTEIAQTVGFSGQGAFGAAFKRVEGASPGAWQRQLRGRAFRVDD